MSDLRNMHALPPMARLYDLMNERGTWPRSNGQRMGSFHSTHRNPVPRSLSYSRIQTVSGRPSPLIASGSSSSSFIKPRRVSSFSSISTSGSISRHIGDHPEDVIETINPKRSVSNKSSSTDATEEFAVL